MTRILLSAIALLAGGCQTKPPQGLAPPAVVAERAAGWRGEALPEDALRIQTLRGSWHRALDAARKAGLRRQVEAEGRLLDPAGALAFPAPSPGSYMCRAIKFAPATRGSRAFQTFKPFFCYVGADGDRLFLTKQTGTERPSGFLWAGEGDNRLIFLGSMAEGAEDASIPYGSDRSRDLAGVFERVGPLRFRLVIPRDMAQGRLDIYELVPAPVQNDE